MPTPDWRAISLSVVATPPRVGSRKRTNRRATGAHGGDQAVQRGGVGNDGRCKAEALALRHDRHAMLADAAGNDDLVAGSRTVARKSSPSATTPTPVVVMYTPSPAPF
jgi:hypothetical protein